MRATPMTGGGILLWTKGSDHPVARDRTPRHRTYVAETDAERDRLRALVRRLGDQDLPRPMEAGWTVAAVLAHAAF